MTNLIAKLESDPSDKNVNAIRKHISKHPMATMCLSLEQLKMLEGFGL